MRLRFSLLLLFSIVQAAHLFAQDEEPPKLAPPPRVETEEIVRIETRLVEVPIVVTDQNGKPLLNLKQSDFAVFENGQSQEISEFFTTSEPFEVALLLDTSGSTRNDLRLIRRAAADFIKSLRSGDRVAVVAFNSRIENGQTAAVIEVITSLTDDRAELAYALETVAVSNGTPYYDGIIQIIEEVFRNKPEKQFSGRRAIVALTDGVDSSSLSEFGEVRDNLQQTGVAAYFVKVDTREYFEDLLLGDCAVSVRFSNAQMQRYYGSYGRGSKIEKQYDFCRLGDFERLDMSKRLYEIADTEMNDLAGLSGGKVFPAASLGDARAAFAQVAAEIGTRYSLGYYSTNQAHDGTFRRIKVELKKLPPGATVRAREGYTAPGK